MVEMGCRQLCRVHTFSGGWKEHSQLSMKE
jgi:hypothetical protein